MAEGSEDASLGNAGELADLFDAGSDGDAMAKMKEADLDAVKDVDELRKIAKTLLRQRNEVLDLVRTARSSASSGNDPFSDLASAVSEALMLDVSTAGSSSAKQSPSDPNKLYQKDGSEMLPDLDTIGDSVASLGDAISEALMLDPGECGGAVRA